MTTWQERLGGLSATELDGGLTVHVARRAGERRRGLAGIDALPRERALHILHCPAVHTFGMRFPLDLIWLDRHAKIVRVDRDVAPNRGRVCIRARSVIETRGGCADDFVAAGTRGGYTRPC